MTPDEGNLNIAGAITGRGLFCVVLPDGPGPADTIEGGWCAPSGFAGRGWIWFADGPAFVDAVEGGWFGPWDSAEVPGFGFLTDQHLQTLSREVGLALGDLAGEAGFGFLMDQHLQMLSREVGLALGDSAGEPGLGLHHRLSEKDCLVAGYSLRPEETFVVGYSPMQHLIF